jgi:hypothetical protein
MVTERSVVTEAPIEVIAPLEADEERRPVDATLGRCEGHRVRVGVLLSDLDPDNVEEVDADTSATTAGLVGPVLHESDAGWSVYWRPDTTSSNLSVGSRAYRRARDRVSTVSAAKLHLGGRRVQGVRVGVQSAVRSLHSSANVERGQEVLPTCVDLRRCSAGGWWLVHCRVHDGRQRSGEAVRRVARTLRRAGVPASRRSRALRFRVAVCWNRE